MSGGGARAAYQVGVMKCIANHWPDLELPLVNGVSAGAINAAHLAGFTGPFDEAVEDLADAWTSLTPEKVFRVDSWSLLRNAASWVGRLLSGTQSKRIDARGLVDSSPLRSYLTKHLNTDPDGYIKGIQQNLTAGSLLGVAISTTDYLTGQSITWTQGCSLEKWENYNQRSRKTVMHVDHVMASAALPVFMPAIQLGESWHGDGGLRLYAPLSPAVHLDADKILAISARYNRSLEEEEEHITEGYPPPAQIFGVTMNSIFLDMLEQDADRLESTNKMLEDIPPEKRDGKKIIDLFRIRPSQDLGKLASRYEDALPGLFKYLLRGQGIHELRGSDWLSMILFHKDYISQLIKIGEKDAENNLEKLRAFLEA